MLEDPSYGSVVRWGDELDSFVVLEVDDNPGSVTIVAFWPDSFDRTKNSQSPSCRSTSSIATSPVLFVSSTSMTSTKSDTTTKKGEGRLMALE